MRASARRPLGEVNRATAGKKTKSRDDHQTAREHVRFRALDVGPSRQVAGRMKQGGRMWVLMPRN